MEIRKDLKLVDVVYENEGKKAIMTFLDEERGQIRPVTFNKQIYQDGKYIDDLEKSKQVGEWCHKYFDTDFAGLQNCIGVTKDVYCYDRFNSLWESEQTSKFTADMVGTIIQTTVKKITVDHIAIRIQYDYEGSTFESKMIFASYIESMKKWFEDPQKKEKVFAKFEEKFCVPVEKADTLVGHPLMVEIKSAFGSNYYGDIKKFPQKKK